MRYKSKPVTIEAIQWIGTESNQKELLEFTGGLMCFGQVDGQERAEVYDCLQDNWVNVNLNDYIIKGTKGEFYPCDPEVFEQKYEVDDELGFKVPEFRK